MRCFVVMGVSGCGKSSVGAALAGQCAMTFIDGDDLHPRRNIEKMASGVPLDDTDRAPWLAEVGKALASAPGPVVIGCSALKRRYRDIIRIHAGEPVHYIHLAADRAVLARRVNERAGHFMPPALLDSQYAALESLDADESATVINIDAPLDDVIAQAANAITTLR